MLAVLISSLLISGALSATCNECWDEYSTCEWNAESSAWDECSQVWEEGSGYAPFNKECIEQQSQTAVQCYTNAGCFEAGNQDCWWKLWDLGCSPYKCEAYTICYENHKNEAGCDQQLQTCEQDCDDSDYDYGYDSGYNSGYDSGSYYYDDSGYDHNYDYYGSYNDNYYGSYDYNYYDEEWEYAEEEIPECIKEACETQLNQCASSDACIQGIENMVNQCYAEYEGSMECMDNLITESQGNGALELCEQNQECATDLQALGECVIQSANYGYCDQEESEKVKPKLLAKAVEAIKNKKANKLKRKNAALRNKQRSKQRQRSRLQRRPASRPRPGQRQRPRPERQRGRPAARGRSRRKLLSSGCCECTDPKHSPFCNAECNNEICPLDSYCCKHRWDWICADAAENVCNGEEADGYTSSYDDYSSYDPYSYSNYDYSPYDSYSGYDYSPYDYSSNYDSYDPYSYSSYDYSPYDSYTSDYSPYDYSPYDSYSGYDYSPYDYNSYDYSPSSDYYGYDSYVPPSKGKGRSRGRVQRRPRSHLRRRQRRGKRVRAVRPRGAVRRQRVRSKVQARQRHGLQRRARQQRSRLALLRRARQERRRRVRPASKRRERRKLTSSEGCCECTDAKGSPFCNPECNQEICPLDSYCCNNQWDWICANAASNVCDGKDAYNYGPYSYDEPGYTPNEYGSDNSGSCCECTSAKGEAYCNSACDQEICPLDPYCCNNKWDWICADAASNVCNDQEAYGYNSYDYSSYDNYNYPSYDYSYDPYSYPSYDYSSYDSSSYDPYSYDYSGYDSYNYPSYDYSSYDSGYDNYNYPSYDPYSYDYSGYDSYGSDYGYNNYDYSGYDYSGYDYSGYDSCGPDSCGSGYDEPEEWEYDEEEIPTCIKEACGTQLAQCASSEACIQGIEGIANGCYNDNESPVECMDTLITESEGNGALQLCNNNEQCATDLQALGECVIQSANYGMCENEPVKKKKELLKGLVKGLLSIKKQRVERLKQRNKQKLAERKRREQRRFRPRPRPRPRPVRRERISREERLRRDRARKASLARGASLGRRGRLQRRHRLRARPRVERRERRERK